MACPPFLAKSRDRALEALAEGGGGIALAARGGQERLRVEHAQRAQDLRCSLTQVPLDGDVLGRARVHGLGSGGARLLPPAHPRLAQRAALVRGDPQRPRKRVPPRIELRRPREDLQQSGLRSVLRLGPIRQRARRERAQDRPQRREDRLERRAIPVGQAAHPALERVARAAVHFTSRTGTPRTGSDNATTPPNPPPRPPARSTPARASPTAPCASSYPPRAA